jgi:hypothetical protein
LRLTIDGSDASDLSVVLAPAASITGRLSVDGRAFHSRVDSHPSVEAIGASQNAVSGGATSSLVDSDGRFVIHGLSGQFVLRPDRLPTGFALERVVSQGVDVTDTGVTLHAGRGVADVEVALTSRPSVVEGILRGGIGAKTVVVFATDSSKWSFPASRYVASAPIDAQARFLVIGLPPGEYFIVAHEGLGDSLETDASVLGSLIPRAQRVVLSPGGRTFIQLNSPI